MLTVLTTRCVRAAAAPRSFFFSSLSRTAWRRRPAAGGALSFSHIRLAAAQPFFIRGSGTPHVRVRDARGIPAGAARRPGFAMAYWGEAMTYNQTLWRNEDVGGGAQVLARLGSTTAVRGRAPRHSKGRGSPPSRSCFGRRKRDDSHRNYADAMGRMYARDPDDPEVGSFYALALLGTVSRASSAPGTRMRAHAGAGRRRHPSAGGGHSPGGVGIASAATPAPCTTLCMTTTTPCTQGWRSVPRAGWRRPRPNQSHALHMPSHIFLQLGLWRDAALSDRAAFDASKAWVQRRNLGPACATITRCLAQYELLQRGRYTRRGRRSRARPFVRLMTAHDRS